MSSVSQEFNMLQIDTCTRKNRFDKIILTVINFAIHKNLIAFIYITRRYAVDGKCRGELKWKTSSDD